MQQHHSDGLTWFQFDLFTPLADKITHGIFTRAGGVSDPPYAALNGSTISGDTVEAVTENRARIVAALPGNPVLVTIKPVHGRSIAFVDGSTPYLDHHGASLVPGEADALLTTTPNLGLFWAYADCAPIMIVDPDHDAIALVHAGWRGTSQAVAVHALRAMGERFGTRPEQVLVGIGPTIGPCCYEIDEPVVAAFRADPIASRHMTLSTISVEERGQVRQSLRLDVGLANRLQLLEAGVREDHLEQHDLCTGHNLDHFYSHRIERGRTGRHAVVIALRD